MAWQAQQILIFIISSGQTNHITHPGRPLAPALLKLFGLTNCTVVIIGRDGATVLEQLVGLILFTISQWDMVMEQTEYGWRYKETVQIHFIHEYNDATLRKK